MSESQQRRFLRDGVSEESNQKRSESMKGRVKTPEHLGKIRQSQLGKKRNSLTLEHRRRISESLKKVAKSQPKDYQRMISNRLLSYSGRSVSSGTHDGVWMRCLNSEGVFAQQLDRVNIKWVYEPKRFDLGWTTYLPDFYLPELDIYIEVKGWMNPLSQRKVDSFRETGKTLVVVMQDELERQVY